MLCQRSFDCQLQRDNVAIDRRHYVRSQQSATHCVDVKRNVNVNVIAKLMMINVIMR